MNLSTKQREVVESTDKYICVVAGAGSGKTRTLIERIRFLIESNRQGERVLAITFSNKAANELKERLLLSYTQSELSELVYVGTIHSFCMDIISQRSTSIGLPNDLHIFEGYEDRIGIFKTALMNIPQLRTQYADYQGNLDMQRVRDLFEKFGKAKRNLKFPEDYPQSPMIQRLYQDYKDLMLSQNAIDFDDILLYAYRILIEKPSIARIYHRIYKHICVDEAQDLNKAQYSVIKAIAGNSASVLMVGDPNQSIYGFNGSSPQFMCDFFIREFQAIEYSLDENYRSSQKVIEAAKVIEPSFEMTGILPIVGEFTVQRFANEAEEANWIVEKVSSLLTGGHSDIEGTTCVPEKCAVLARNRYVFSILEEALKEKGIEYNLRVSSNRDMLSESPFIKIFDLGLRLIMNPQDIIHFEEMKGAIGLSQSKQSSFGELRDSQVFYTALGEKGAEALNCAWNIITKEQQNFRFNEALEVLKEYSTPSDSDLDDNEYSMMYNDCLAWDNRWRLYTRSTTVDERSLAHMMRAIALGVTSIPTEVGITLSTVHMSKGLEFDVVFIIGLNEGVFPDYRALNDESQLAEEQHNMFVSITRSKRLCYLSYPAQRLMPWGKVRMQSPSRYVQLLAEHFED